LAGYSGFVAELRRRNVFRVGVAYAIVAWIVLQVAAIAFPALHLPAWTVTFVTILIILGFPLVVVFAWAYEVTPEGIKPTHQVNPAESIAPTTGRMFDRAIIVMLLAAVIFLVVDNYVLVDEEQPTVVEETITADRQPESVISTATELQSIAVLPFVNMSADPAQEYFSDGISEEILNGLANVDALRVAARTSSFYFKGEKVDLQTVADKLNVNHVLEGSVRKAGNRLRITAQLIKADDGFHLWSKTYDRELTDIFAVQDEIAKAVVEALKIELGVAAGSTLVDIGTSDRDAYDWYLRGKDALTTGAAERIERGIEFFEHAIEIDPDYADAYAYVAYALILTQAFTPYKEIAPAIKQAYSKALELEPSHREALCAQGHVKIFSEWDWAAAGKLFRAGTRGGKLNDVCLGTYVWWYPSALGRYDEGISVLRNAERDDPLNHGIKFQLGVYLGFFNVEWKEGISALRAVLDAAPNHVFALADLTTTYLNAGQLELAEAALTRLENLKVPDAYPYIVHTRVELEVLSGDRAEAQSVYDEGRRVAESGVNKSPNLWFSLGLAAVFLGHLEEAIGLFSRSYEERSLGIIWVRSILTSWPPYTQGHGPALLSHPDFQAFLAKMNLDDASIAALEAAE